MKINLSRSSVVVAGAWNVAIFGPEFVAQNIFRGPEAVRPEMAFGPEGPRPLYRGPNFELLVQPSRTIWRPRSIEDSVLQELEEAVVRVLDVLSVTPISAVGVNFGFDIDVPTESLEGVMNLPDRRDIEGAGEGIASVTIKRSVPIGDTLLNFTITREIADIMILDFNFHQDVASAKAAKKHLSGSVRPRREFALRLLRDWYGLKLEET